MIASRFELEKVAAEKDVAVEEALKIEAEAKAKEKAEEEAKKLTATDVGAEKKAVDLRNSMMVRD